MLTKQAEKGKVKFLQKAKEMFGDKFDYSLAEKEYVNTYTPVTIICKEHGPFPQRPVRHIAINSLGGCPLCPKKHTSKKLTREEFIERARSVHKDKYDYSLVEYVGLKKKVKIICPIHGVFEQVAQEHLHAGHGCSLCGGSAKLDTQSFIKKAREKHGDKYDYSLVDYVNRKKKVKIICPVHGVFEQAARSHLEGRGCELCADNTTTYKDYAEKLFKTFGDAYICKEETFINASSKAAFVCKKHGEFIGVCANVLNSKVPCEKCKIENLKNNFIKKAVEKHGDKFDYSDVVYVDRSTEVKIICKKHGVFTQKPENHLKGNDPCPLCREEKKKNTEQFIEEAKAIHHDKYDYSLVEYVNTHKKVKIICPVHGDFYQRPDSHLKGEGCYECRNKTIADKLRKDAETFIKEAKRKFNNFYDYSKVEYKTNDVPVCVICPIHGEFYVTPNHHLAHYVGCTMCSAGKGGFLTHETGKLYIMVDDLEAPTMMKIGVSVKEEVRRRNVLNSARRAGVTIPALHVAKTWEGPTHLMQRIEQMMHENYEEWNIKFPAKFDGCTEFFQYTPETAEAFDIIEETLHEIINANKAA